MNIGVHMSGGHGKRDKNGLYPTPKEATYAVLSHIKTWPKDVWEPACGAGDMSSVLTKGGFSVVSTDIQNHGFGIPYVDFLTADTGFPKVVITDPPFPRAGEFILHGNAIEVTHMALLLKVQFWHAATRLKVWDVWPPYAVLPLTWRLDFDGRGNPVMDCVWCLWDRTSPPLPRPPVKPDLELVEMSR